MKRSAHGFTFIELVVVTAILMILASTIMPMAQVVSRRQKEVELRRSLREMRTAIDKFKDAVDQGQIPTTELEPGNEGYPPDLETLVGKTSWEFFDHLLSKANLVGTPGSGFGASGEGYFRLSAFNSRANIEEAVRRIDVADEDVAAAVIEGHGSGARGLGGRMVRSPAVVFAVVARENSGSWQSTSS